MVAWLMGDTRRWWTLSLALLLLGLAWAWDSRVPVSASSPALPYPRPSFVAPAFALPALGNEALALAVQPGQVTVVNFWASWCGPCRAEMPALEKVYQANRSRGFQVLAVNSTVQDRESSAQAFVGELELTFPVLLDRDGTATRLYRVEALPTTFWIDRRGVIRRVQIGGTVSQASLQAQADALLQELP